MYQHRVEGDAVRLLAGGEDHARHPEEDDVVAGDEHVRGVEIVEVRRLIRPAERGEGPEGAGKPGVQHVRVLRDVLRVAALALRGVLLRDGDVPAVVAVPGGDAVAPPELAGDAPVADVVHPVQIGLGEAVGDEFDFPVLHHADGLLGQRLHLDEPLVGVERLHVVVAAVAGAHAVGVVLHLYKVATGLKVGHDGLAGLVAVHAVVLAAVYHAAVLVQHEDELQAVALGDLEVVGVVARRHLHAAGAEVHLDVFIRHDGYLAPHEREYAGLADYVLIALVGRVDGYAGVAQHGLRAGGGDYQVAAAVAEGIADVPEMARLIDVLHLRVAQRGGALGAPVDDLLALVDELFLIEVDEGLAHGLGAGVVHREALALPVAGAAERFQLLDDAVAELVLPGPDFVQEALAAQVEAGLALVAQLFLNLYLRGDAGVVIAGQPEGAVAVHALVAYQDVLYRLVEGMAQVELPRDVRGGMTMVNGFFAGVALGVEIAAVEPHVVDLLLDLAGVVHFRKLFHFSSSIFIPAARKKAPRGRSSGRSDARYHLNSTRCARDARCPVTGAPVRPICTGHARRSARRLGADLRRRFRGACTRPLPLLHPQRAYSCTLDRVFQSLYPVHKDKSTSFAHGQEECCEEHGAYGNELETDSPSRKPRQPSPRKNSRMKRRTP